MSIQFSEMLESVRSGNAVELSKLLKENNLDLNLVVKPEKPTLDTEVTLLQIASARGHSEVVRLLLQAKGINPDFTTKRKLTALHWAAYAGKANVCLELLPHINVLAKDTAQTIAYFAAKDSMRPNAKFNKIFLEVMDVLRVPTFVAACAAGDLQLVKKMVEEEGVDVNAIFEKYSDGQENFTGLQAACLGCHTTVVAYLLSLKGDKKVDVNKRNNLGFTALHVICRHSSNQPLSDPESIVTKEDREIKRLMASNSPEATEFRERSRDEQAIRIDIANDLILAGADLNSNDNKLHATPLMISSVYNQLDLTRLLVVRGANINVTYTPIKGMMSRPGLFDTLATRSEFAGMSIPEIDAFCHRVENEGSKPMSLLDYARGCRPEISVFLEEVVSGKVKPNPFVYFIVGIPVTPNKGPHRLGLFGDQKQEPIPPSPRARQEEAPAARM